MKRIGKIDNLDCAVCAAKLERAIAAVDGVQQASVNFFTQKLTIEIDDANQAEVIERVLKAAKKAEPSSKISGLK